jgi:hypothetical protein
MRLKFLNIFLSYQFPYVWSLHRLLRKKSKRNTVKIPHAAFAPNRKKLKTTAYSSLNKRLCHAFSLLKTSNVWNKTKNQNYLISLFTVKHMYRSVRSSVNPSELRTAGLFYKKKAQNQNFWWFQALFQPLSLVCVKGGGGKIRNTFFEDENTSKT